MQLIVEKRDFFNWTRYYLSNLICNKKLDKTFVDKREPKADTEMQTYSMAVQYKIDQWMCAKALRKYGSVTFS